MLERQLGERKQVAAPEPEPSTGLDGALRGPCPLHPVDAEGSEEHVVREALERHVHRALEQEPERGDAGGAVAEAPAVLAVPRTGGERGEAADGEVEEEPWPVLDEVHPLLVPAAELVPVVALEERAHGEEVLDREPVLARVRAGEGLAVLEVRSDARADARQELPVDGHADQVAGQRLRRRAGVEERVAPGVSEVALEDQRTVACDEQSRQLHQRAGAYLLLDGLERDSVDARRRGFALGPGSATRRERDAEQCTGRRHGSPLVEVSPGRGRTGPIAAVG